MAAPAIDYSKRFTYGDYKAWSDGERWELIDGEAFSMSPSPTTRHQAILLRLAMELGAFLKGRPCRLFIAPLDVLLPGPAQSDYETNTVVQPDILVVCDAAKLSEGFVRGPPDLVVELLSPNTEKRDLKDKYELYERSGVREYWVIEPAACWLRRYLRGEDGHFGQALYRQRGDGKGLAASNILEGFDFDLEELFATE